MMFKFGDSKVYAEAATALPVKPAVPTIAQQSILRTKKLRMRGPR